MPRCTVCISSGERFTLEESITSETTILLLELAEQSGLRQHLDATDSAH